MFMHLTTTQEIHIVNILITEKFLLFYIRKHFVLAISSHWVVCKVTGPQTTYFFPFWNTWYWYFSMIVKNCQVIAVCHISYYKYISELLGWKALLRQPRHLHSRLVHPSVSSAVAGGEGKAKFGVCGHCVWAAGAVSSSTVPGQQWHPSSTELLVALRQDSPTLQTPGNWEGMQPPQGNAGSCAAVLQDCSKLCSWCNSSSGITGLCFADKIEMRICMTPWKQTQRFTLLPWSRCS